MSELMVRVEQVSKVKRHPNADRLDIATVRGWECVVGRGEISVGDFVVYIPVDSVLPQELEARLFSGTKVKLHNRRVRAARIRGAVSEGLAVPFAKMAEWYPELKMTSGLYCADILGIVKFEPEDGPKYSTGSGKRAWKENRNFKKYTDIQHFKNYHNGFRIGEEIVVTEKLHGTNFRAGYVRLDCDGFLERVLAWAKRIIGFRRYRHKGYEFVCGSHNAQMEGNPELLQDSKFGMKTNVYKYVADAYGLDDVMWPGEVLYGEIIGAGIQRGYDYGKRGEVSLRVFDVMVDGKYLDWEAVDCYCESNCLRTVPVLYNGEYLGIYQVAELSSGMSKEHAGTVREGCVVKPVREKTAWFGRQVLKVINPDFNSNPNNTDYH